MMENFQNVNSPKCNIISSKYYNRYIFFVIHYLKSRSRRSELRFYSLRLP